jgi:hypothetical protein
MLAAPKPITKRSERCACRPAATRGHGTYAGEIVAAAKSSKAIASCSARMIVTAFGVDAGDWRPPDAGATTRFVAFARTGAERRDVRRSTRRAGSRRSVTGTRRTRCGATGRTVVAAGLGGGGAGCGAGSEAGGGGGGGGGGGSSVRRLTTRVGFGSGFGTRMGSGAGAAGFEAVASASVVARRSIVTSPGTAAPATGAPVPKPEMPTASSTTTQDGGRTARLGAPVSNSPQIKLTRGLA